ncbi:MAG: SWIM zinc finger domain-containing protein [Saprospiraceae bacterium]|nr:SWIM zinc finger domain-containing protein [Saprospiraceae bacterium]
MALSYQKILELAPDAIVIERAKSLSRPQHWVARLQNDAYIWGESKSSGSQTYLVSVDRATLQARCTCRSSKQPCKHALGILFSFLDFRRGFLFEPDTPDWVPIKGSALPAPETKDKLHADNQKRLEKRIALMKSGLQELEAFLLDMSQQGLASLENEPASYWDEIAARMVDAKLGSIGRKIRSFKSIFEEPEWLDRLAGEIAQLYLFCQGFRQLEHLPAEQQDDFLSFGGLNQKKDELLSQKPVKDQWLVIGKQEGEEENLRWRRTWLIGVSTARFALLLDFAWGREDFPMQWPLASAYQGEVVFYPGAWPLRAIMKQYRFQNDPIDGLPGFTTFVELSSHFAKALAQNPLMYTIPALLAKARISRQGDDFFFVDAEQRYIRLEADEQSKWKLLALSAGSPIGVFGEWNGQFFTPQSVFTQNRVVSL